MDGRGGRSDNNNAGSGVFAEGGFSNIVGGSGVTMWLAFVLSQLYIVARLLLKLQFIASQIALFQANLAHASYVSAPVPTWPDSPAAEAIGPSPRSA